MFQEGQKRMAVCFSARDLKPGIVLAESAVGKDRQENLPAEMKLVVRHTTPPNTREANQSWLTMMMNRESIRIRTAK
jgi:hypothetical protein